MQIETSVPAADQIQYTLPAVVTLDTIREIADGLKKLSPGSSATLVLDVSKIEIISTPGVQMLIAAAKSAKEANGKIRMASINAAVLQAFEDIGLASYVKEWEQSNG